MVTEQTPLPPAESPPVLPAGTAKPASRFRRLLVAAVYLYCVLIVAIWALMAWDGDRGWLATLVLFGPRWVFALPLPLLAIAAAAFDRRLLWPVVFAAATLLVPILGFRLHMPASAAEPARLRVLTCNVHEDGFRPQSLAYLIASEEPDVVALQEVCSATKFIWPPGWHVLNRDEFTLASRWPITEHERIARNPHELSAVRYTVDLPDGALQVFNVHLESPRKGFEAVMERNRGFDLSRTAELDEVLQRRADESAAVSAWIAGFDGPRLIMGDFNMPPDSTIYGRSWASLGNGFSSTGWGLGFTKITRARGLNYGARIDHVLFTPEWRCLRCWVGQDIGSDHLPLLADFQ